jgi:hypothetical protein
MVPAVPTSRGGYMTSRSTDLPTAALGQLCQKEVRKVQNLR